MKARPSTSPGSARLPGVGILVTIICPMLATAAPDEVATASSKGSPASSLSVISDQTFLEERRAIAGEFEELEKAGATEQQVAGWQEKNAARMAAMRKKAEAMAAGQETVKRPYIREIRIPADASATMEDFLMERAKLYNEQIRIQNQLPPQATAVERGEALEKWRRQNAAVIGAQDERARQISAESESAPLPPSQNDRIPGDASPALRDFLTCRNALMKKEEAEVTAHLQTATPEQRQHALELWRAKNLERLQAVQDAAVFLSEQSKSSN